MFLDETGAKANMTRCYARAKKGERAVDYAPHGHWGTTTLVAGITSQAAIAPMMLDGPMDATAFAAYVEHVLIPDLPAQPVVVMDNLSVHKSAKAVGLLEAEGARVLYLPPYSPDFNPIEQMWSKVKSYLRGIKARTEEELIAGVATALSKITPDDAAGFFRHSFVCV